MMAMWIGHKTLEGEKYNIFPVFTEVFMPELRYFSIFVHKSLIFRFVADGTQHLNNIIKVEQIFCTCNQKLNLPTEHLLPMIPEPHM